MSETVDILAIGAHPDDVEIGCGATLALLARQERRVGLVHLSAGERGTRGDAETRRAEARRAAELLGAGTVDFLDCGDAPLRHGEVEEDALIAVLRRRRPQLVFAPPPRDRHPDHARAHGLVLDACYYAGLVRREAGGVEGPHRPATVFSYMGHDPFEPRFIVDVSSTWEVKRRALAAYESQLHRPGASGEGPETKISSPQFLQAVEGRARHYGLLIGAAFGEPFWSPLPIAVHDPWTLRPRGLP